MPRKYRLLIGGIGDDAHSAGIRMLALGFKEEGFLVKNLGIQNTTSDFIDYACDFDVVMLSNNNGHAELYVEDFGYLLSSIKLASRAKKLWYLGGNLTVSESDFAIKKKFLKMGFTNVFPKPISFEQVLTEVHRDLQKYGIHKKEVGQQEKPQPFVRINHDLSGISDDKWTSERLRTEREIVLTEWETGREVDIDNDQLVFSPEKNLDRTLWAAKTTGALPLLQPRTGVADLDKQIEILRYLELAGIDIASTQLDAASRTRSYATAKSAVLMSKERNNSLLNGFPVPIHGVSGVRKLVDSLHIPYQLRAGGYDHRFTYEIALHGGASGVEGGFICYLFPYDKLTSPVESFSYWQYVDRLCATYFEKHGALINREYFGTLTANLIEPSLPIAVNIVQAVLSARQGVRSISVGYAEQGNRSQDIAAMSVMEDLTKKYLRKYRQFGCRVTTVFHQYMAAFPKDEAKAEDLIYNSAITGALSGATKIMTKTRVEAFKIPSMSENAGGVAIARRGIRAAASEGVQLYDAAVVALEKEMLVLEVTQILDAVEELGNGSLSRGTIRAFQEGYLDIPFSPNLHNRNEVVTLRDRGGAVRFAEFGNLPFTTRVKDFHREKLAKRKLLERDSKIFSLLEKDLSRIWKNDYRQWPLDGLYVN